MTDSNVFDNEPGGDPSNQSPTNIWDDKLKTITNGDGEQKYKTVEDALEALQHSQNFIEQLKSESQDKDGKLAELTAELGKRESVEDVINKLLSKNQEPAPPQADPPKNEGSSLDEKKVEELVKQALNTQNQESVAQNNVNTVSQKLSEKFGDKAAAVVAERAKQMGTTPQALQELSKAQPGMVLALFEDTAPIDRTPTTPTTNTPKGNNKQMELFDLKPEKSIMRGGASSADVKETMRRIKEHTYQKLGVVE